MDRKRLIFLIVWGFFGVGLAPGQDLAERYNQMDFAGIVRELQDVSPDCLTMEQQLLLAESQARLGDGGNALTELQRLLAKSPDDDRILTSAGIVYHSLGKFTLAEACLTRALELNPRNSKALLTRTMLLLYLRRFSEAEASFRQADKAAPGLRQTRLFQRIGSELYSATQRPADMRRYFEYLRDFYASKNDAEKSAKYRRKIRLLAAADDQLLYRVHSHAERVELPLVDLAPGVYYKCLLLPRDGKTYRILLDTGNAVGWTIHHPDLLTLLENRFGGEQSVATGSLEKSLKSRELLTVSLDLGDCKLTHLLGLFFKKPRENYFDANLNPIFIRNRVVTLDFVHNKFLLRSKAQFDRDLAAEPLHSLVKLPFYGYEWPFVPVEVNGYASALAMIETGAEDLSLKEAFARFIHLPLTPATRVWGDRKLSYYEASEVSVQFGPHILYRPRVEIWPKRFYDRITGLYDQVMIGPFALQDRFIISFDPFDNVVVIQSARRD
ncbi:tetratricopeptide repeat protein [Caldithrix abyssi]